MRESTREGEPMIFGGTTLVPLVRTRLLTMGASVLATKSCIAILVRDGAGERRFDVV